MGKKNSKAANDDKKQEEQKPLTKTEKFAKEIVDYFKNQVNIDIEQYRDATTKMFDNSRMINIDWNSVPKSQQYALMEAVNKPYSPYVATKSGTWMWTIMKK